MSNTKNTDQDFAQSLQNDENIDVIAEVDIENKAVQDVFVVKNTASQDNDQTSGSQDAKEAVKQTAKDAKQTAKETLDNTKADAKQSAKDVAKDAKDALDGAKESVKDTVKDTADQAKQKAKDVAQKAEDAVENVKADAKQAADTAKQAVQDAATNTKNTAQEVLDSGKAKVEEGVEKLDEIKQQAAEAITDKKDELAQKADDLTEQGKGFAKDALAKADELKTEAVQRLKDSTTEAKERLVNVKDEAKAAFDNVLETAKTKLDDLKSQADDQLESGKESAKDALQQLDEKTHATEYVEQAKSAIQGLQDDAKKLQDDVQNAAQKASESAAAYEQEGKSGFAFNLTKLGAYLGGLYGVDQKEAYQGIDLNQHEFKDSAFYKQGTHIAGQLFGSKVATAQKLVTKVVPQSKFDRLAQSIFDKLADWAGSWATKDLSKDSRFHRLGQLTDRERDDFAHEIANQNRALAALGGATGVAGLIGVILDSAWLLLVSLKSVYQIAAIYDKPLTGRDGAKLAYGVLSGAGLEKLQEKQIILTALALAKSVISHADQTDVATELKKVGSQFSSAQLYTKQLDDLAQFVNLDKLNNGLLGAILPLASVAVGVHYNNELINEVLGTAKATFRPERPKLLVAPIEAGKDDTATDE
ncbi:EcsC family protein [Moraxella nasovis]|uniref:EcsC family protein n=1 Tax=Moraxella nasovis TaxID=2904121 RepID=UPI001F606822|nr:EcsC family protein [Moraxella nasovis]UNU74021.1 EcsC family protein [Moraxella nasovis]